MPRGVSEHNYRSRAVTKKKLDKFLEGTQYQDDTKDCIRFVFSDDTITYQEAAERFGISRQRVFNIVKGVSERLGLDTRVADRAKE